MAEYIDRDALLKDIDETIIFSIKGEAETSPEIRGANKVINRILDTPTAGVVEKDKYEHLLKIAKKMHTWIFLHTEDEQKAYDEIGLTEEDNAMLGYIGSFGFERKE